MSSFFVKFNKLPKAELVRVGKGGVILKQEYAEKLKNMKRKEKYSKADVSWAALSFKKQQGDS